MEHICVFQQSKSWTAIMEHICVFQQSKSWTAIHEIDGLTITFTTLWDYHMACARG